MTLHFPDQDETVPSARRGMLGGLSSFLLGLRHQEPQMELGAGTEVSVPGLAWREGLLPIFTKPPQTLC